MNHTINGLLLTAIITTLSGCAGMNDDFSCKKIDGIAGCASMTDINNLVTDGKIASDNDGHVTRHLDGGEYAKKPNGNGANQPSSPVTRTVFTAVKNPKTPYRTRDKTATITIFAYKDADGNLHETHDVYTVVEHSHWVNP
ncbi:type IV conjugative transfer system protein TraV [Photobacterium phosphoreum]|uniref:type IV conjugative transfer system lipoprotein TraV n=1 Tax=Photobacterium phosphoreum TaxID=659 RepID=UPI000D1743C1|nr:type IV conjugative transfer system lipoprotein TraV [Photobacterium phosphoreum]PSW22711.1 type IV conjugative transfer system protein TraV [Photobacterium phosphoreum]